mmetsp:Transcript_9036/g.13807  ORF Transcript_9036/g.13807 Transcript_9036/m.13807 type:complete len:108 (+) Transcript_9036:114-437(+)
MLLSPLSWKPFEVIVFIILPVLYYPTIALLHLLEWPDMVFNSAVAQLSPFLLAGTVVFNLFLSIDEWGQENPTTFFESFGLTIAVITVLATGFVAILLGIVFGSERA